jgi:hypothetical protein
VSPGLFLTCRSDFFTPLHPRMFSGMGVHAALPLVVDDEEPVLHLIEDL